MQTFARIFLQLRLSRSFALEYSLKTWVVCILLSLTTYYASFLLPRHVVKILARYRNMTRLEPKCSVAKGRFSLAL